MSPVDSELFLRRGIALDLAHEDAGSGCFLDLFLFLEDILEYAMEVEVGKGSNVSYPL